MKLGDFQQQFRAWLETGDPDRAPGLGNIDRAGLAVYLNNYRLQLMDCLAEVFPVTCAWLGEEVFKAACRRHIMACPPDSWTLDDYPATFAAHVADLFPDDAVVGELAELEQALGDAFTAPDKVPLTRAMFADRDWEQVALTHAAGGRILRHLTNAGAIWSALTRGDCPPALEQAAAPHAILVWRAGQVPCFRQLDDDEALILDQFNAAMPFTDMCSLLGQRLGPQEAVTRAGLLLARWADDEAVSIA